MEHVEDNIRIPPKNCPYCHTDTSDASYGFVEISGFSACQPATCSKCDKTWWEIYEFTRIELQED